MPTGNGGWWFFAIGGGWVIDDAGVAGFAASWEECLLIWYLCGGGGICAGYCGLVECVFFHGGW